LCPKVTPQHLKVRLEKLAFILEKTSLRNR